MNAWAAAAMASIMAVSGSLSPATASAATEAPVYGDYSLVFSRSAGQYWADGQVGGQWAWNPDAAQGSRISWGDPAHWPPSYAEVFRLSGDWLLLDGWSDNGTYYTVRVSSEVKGNAACGDLQPIAADGGRQHYVAWTVPSAGYCLKAWGTITEQSSGKTIQFGHTQIWSPPEPCRNQYFAGRVCIKQWESWWDDKDAPGTPITRKLERTQLLARGLGMAFTIDQHYPGTWHADLRYAWTW